MKLAIGFIQGSIDRMKMVSDIDVKQLVKELEQAVKILKENENTK